MGRGDSGVPEERSQLDDKSRADRKRMYNQQRRGGQRHQQRGRGHGRGRGGSRGGGSGGGGGNWNKRLWENMSGFLCSCNMNEKDCTKEALNLLNEYITDEDITAPTAAGFDTLKGEQEDEGTATKADEQMETAEESGHGDGGDAKESDDDDIEASLKAEIRELKSDAVRSRFFSMDTGVPNLIFIKSTVKNPSSLVHRIFEDVTVTKELKARFLLRMVPIEVTCMARMDQIEGVCRSIFPKYFSGNFTSFQIVYKSRYNGNIDRQEVIKVLAALVCEINPLNVVDLTNPTYSIIVEIIKNIVCIGILKDYNKFKKYNLHEVVVDENEKKVDGAVDVEAVDPKQTVAEVASDELKTSESVSGICEAEVKPDIPYKSSEDGNPPEIDFASVKREGKLGPEPEPSSTSD